MKKIIFILLALAGISANAQDADSVLVKMYDSSNANFEAEINYIFEDLELGELSTGIFIDRAISFIDFSIHTGIDEENDSPCYYQTIRAAYNTLLQANISADFPYVSVASLAEAVDGYKASGLVPILVLNMRYNHIKATAVDRGVLTMSSGQYHHTLSPEDPFGEAEIFAAAPAVYTFDTPTVQFIIPHELVINNTGLDLDSIEVDFGDSNGYRTVAVDEIIAITYTQEGKHEINVRIKKDGDYKKARSHIDVSIPVAGDVIYYAYIDETWDIEASGGHSGGNVSVSYACGNKKLTKPLIIVEGFDPPQLPYRLQQHFKEGTNSFYKNMRNASIINIGGTSVDFLEQMAREGYDLVYIDFKDGADYLERNAALFQDVLTRVNTEKATNGSIEPNAVLGISMGGVVAQYGLRDWELNSLDHQTRLFFSLDAPHRGAYVPFSYQLLFREFSNISALTIADYPVFDMPSELAMAIAILETPAAQQLLVTNVFDYGPIVDYNGQRVSKAHADFFIDKYYPMLNLQTCRTVAVSNGSQVQKTQQDIFNNLMGANAHLIDMNGFVWVSPFTAGTDIYIQAYGNPQLTEDVLLFKAKINFTVIGAPSVKIANDEARSISAMLSYDNAPGGTYNFKAFGLDVHNIDFPVNTTFYTERFSFVPTVSALDLVIAGNDLEYDINGNVETFNSTTKITDVTNGLTTFQRYSTPSQATNSIWNETHASLSAQHARLFYDELTGYLKPLTISTISSNQFNFGSYTDFSYRNEYISTSDKLHDITINSGGSIRINHSSGLAYPVQSLHAPDEGSTYQVYTEGAVCGSSATVTVNDGGTLILGDNTTGRKGILHITEGSTLNLNDGSGLMVYEDSKIIIEHNASLNVTDLTQIVLDGENSMIEFQEGATLNIAQNATFTFTGEGFIRFIGGDETHNSITGDGSSIILTGTGTNIAGGGQTDKVLEFIKSESGGAHVNISTGIDYFEVNDGVIHSSANVDFSANMKFSNIKFTALGTPTNVFNRELEVSSSQSAVPFYCFDNVDMDLSFIKEGGSIHALNVNGISQLVKIHNSTFDGSDGLYIYDSKTDFENISFKDHHIAWVSEGMSYPSACVSCHISKSLSATNISKGITYSGSSLSPLLLDKTDVLDMGDAGVSMEGSELIAGCGKIKAASTTSGVSIVLTDDAILTLDPSIDIRAGNMDLSGYTTAINATDADDIRINNANSNFGEGEALSGNIKASYSVLDAEGNYWKWGGAPTKVNHYYYFYDANGQFDDATSHYVNGANFLTTVPDIDNLCPGRENDEAKQGGGEEKTGNLLTPSLIEKTNGVSYRNGEALKPIIQETIKPYGKLTASNLHERLIAQEQLLNYDFAQNTTAVKPALNLVYLKMQSTIGEAAKDGYIEQNPSSPEIRQLIATQDHLLSQLVESDKAERFKVSMDKCFALRLAHRKQEALVLLHDIRTWANKSSTKFINKWDCQLNAEIMLENGQISKKDFLSNIKLCAGDELIKDVPPASVNRFADKQISSTQSLKIYPNPAGYLISINYEANENDAVGIRIIGIDGRDVISKLLTKSSKGWNTANIDIQSLQNGVYFVELATPTETTIKKLTVIR